MLRKFLLRAVFSFLLVFVRNVTAAATNRTIDDKFGDSVTGLKPIFLPTTPGAWEGEKCGGCLVKPDKNQAFKQTFNAATFRPEIGPISIGLSFKGTAIYVFFIIANFVPGDITTLTECNFTLDGQPAGYYRHEPLTSKEFQYNVLAFSTAGLANVNHNLNVSTNGVDYHVFVNFDYAIYTFDDTPDPPSGTTATIPIHTSPSTIITLQHTSNQPTSNSNQQPTNLSIQFTGTFTSTQRPTSQYSSTPVTQIGATSSAALQLDGSNNPPVGTIAGGVVGGLVAVVLLLLLIFYWHKHPRRAENHLPPSKLFDYDTHDSKFIPRYIRGDVFPEDMKNSDPSIIASGSSISLEARHVRRVELERQLHAVERELSILGTESRASSRKLSFSHKVADIELNAEMEELRRQIVQIREMIEYLQTQNLPEPVPGYSDGWLPI